MTSTNTRQMSDERIQWSSIEIEFAQFDSNFHGIWSRIYNLQILSITLISGLFDPFGQISIIEFFLNDEFKAFLESDSWRMNFGVNFKTLSLTYVLLAKTNCPAINTKVGNLYVGVFIQNDTRTDAILMVLSLRIIWPDWPLHLAAVGTSEHTGWIWRPRPHGETSGKSRALLIIHAYSCWSLWQ